MGREYRYLWSYFNKAFVESWDGINVCVSKRKVAYKIKEMNDTMSKGASYITVNLV